MRSKPQHAPDSPSRCALHSIAELSHDRIGQADSLAVGQMANLRLGQVGNVPRSHVLHARVMPERVTAARWQGRTGPAFAPRQCQWHDRQLCDSESGITTPTGGPARDSSLQAQGSPSRPCPPAFLQRTACWQSHCAAAPTGCAVRPCPRCAWLELLRWLPAACPADPSCTQMLQHRQPGHRDTLPAVR